MTGKMIMKAILHFKTHYSVGFDLDEKHANHKEKRDEEEADDGDKAKDDFIIVHFCIDPSINCCCILHFQ